MLKLWEKVRRKVVETVESAARWEVEEAVESAARGESGGRSGVERGRKEEERKISFERAEGEKMRKRTACESPRAAYP
jgi:hypothetical protein